MQSENQISNQLINEDELEDSDRISIYKELIRVIEKDIDGEESANSRKGLSIWGIVIAMAGSLMYVFGETRKFQDVSSLPLEEIKIVFLTALFFIYLVYLFLNSFGGKLNFAKSGRLNTFEDSLYQIRGSLFVRALVLIGVTILVTTTSISFMWQSISSLIISFFTFYSLLYFCLSFIKKKNIGNNPKFDRISIVSISIFYLLNILLVIFFGSQLSYPIGEKSTSAFIIGLLSAGIVFLFELLALTYASSKSVSKLNDLRDDIIFQRIPNLNVALIQYQIIKEGKTLSDELKPLLDELAEKIAEQKNNIANQISLVNKIFDYLPVQGDSREIKENKRKEIKPFYESLNILADKLHLSIENLKVLLTEFNKKMNESTNISGDHTTSNLIHNALNQELVNLDNQIIQLTTARNNVKMYIDNPDIELPNQSIDQITEKPERKRRVLTPNKTRSQRQPKGKRN